MDTLLLVSDQVYFYEFNSQKCFSACKWRTVRQSFHFQKIVGTLKTIFLKFANMCFPFKSINTHNKEKEKLKNVKTFYFRPPPHFRGHAPSQKETFKSEILELVSYNNLAQHEMCPIFFFSKITPPFSAITTL